MTAQLRWRKSRRRAEMFRRAAHAFFLSAGSLALGYCGLEYFRAALYQRSELSRLEESGLISKVEGLDEPATAPVRAVISKDSAFGQIDIPRIGVSTVVVEGITARNLKLAVGHNPGTPLPGESGNAVIAGHRDTFFRSLGRIRENDTIVLRTVYGTYRYSVDSARIAKPSDLTVLASSSEPLLTLITCYPFYHVGPAPLRFVVRASQIRTVDLERNPVPTPTPVVSTPHLDRLYGIRHWFDKIWIR
jgi:LPXTG-site transpeptidase (sortase) family protein